MLISHTLFIVILNIATIISETFLHSVTVNMVILISETVVRSNIEHDYVDFKGFILVSNEHGYDMAISETFVRSDTEPGYRLISESFARSDTEHGYIESTNKREITSAQKPSREHNTKDLDRSWLLSPGERVNTGHVIVNSIKITTSKARLSTN